jgi:putative ABC transport system permease protein
MLKNYFKITLRNLAKHKGYSTINILGLAVGIACCLLIFLYVKDELTYDTYHKNADRIFRITSTVNFGGSERTMAATSFPEGMAYRESIPEVEAAVRLDSDAGIVTLGNDYISQTGLVYTDESLFTIFDFKLIDGAFDGAFKDLNRIIITKDIALKYFGEERAAGKVLEINIKNTRESYYVSAVIANHPSNSSFNFKIALPWGKRESQLNDYKLGSWSNISLNTYLLLKEDADRNLVEAKMEEVRKNQNPGDDELFARQIVNKLQPLADIHLNTDTGSGDGLGNSTDSSYSYILSGIAIIILVIACINFANLSVARSLPRAREIGVRKVLGAQNKQLAFQFLNEAFFMCLISFVLGLILAEFSLPIFGDLIQKTFYQGVWSDAPLMISCLGLVMFTALLSGFYPAFVVSRFNTVKSLKGKLSLRGNSVVSKVLVIVQFTIATVLIVGTIAMNRQIDFMINMDLGYNDTDLVRINSNNSGTPNIAQLFKDELAQNPNIIAVGAADEFNTAELIKIEDRSFAVIFTTMDDQYLDMIGTELLQGRRLKSGRDLFISDKDTLTNVLVNEAFVKVAGFEEPLLKTYGGKRIVGVIKDFHYNSVKDNIDPVEFIADDETNNDQFQSIYVKYKPEYLPMIKGVLEETWRKYVPYKPFVSDFVAESNANQYEEEVRWRQIITYASILAISVSILGLFGLAHLSTQQRVKEIGIRKVLGASLTQIILLLNTQFSKLIVISILLSAPIAYYSIDRWLDNFANAIEVNALLILLPGLITFSIAFITVSLQSVKTANSNPVDSLRNE